MKTAMELLRIVLPVLSLLLVMAAVQGWIWLRMRMNAKNPVTTVRATVIARTVKPGLASFLSRTRVANEYTVTFRPADGGEDLTFDVSETEYRAWRSGDRGTLTYRTWELLSFRPENREATAGDVPVAFSGEDEA